MKKTITATLLVLITLVSFSQSVLQDSTMKMELLSPNSVRLTNLQGCPTAFKVKYPSMAPNDYSVITPVVQPDSSYVIANIGVCGEFRARPATSCSGMLCSGVGANTCLFVLPVNLLYFRTQKSADNILVEFKFGEEPQYQQLLIKITNTDKTTKVVPVPASAKIGDHYSYIIPRD